MTLLVLLILLSAGSYFLLRGLNQAAHGQTAAELTTQRTLNAAREALLGYAARYPDNPGVVLTAGPARLPCPDTRLDSGEPVGAADSPCALSSQTEIGRFPWHTLDVPELLDGSSAPLWYAVSDNFRAHLTTAINSQTPGTLRIDGCTQDNNIVALVIAPGPALTGQSRAPTSYDAAAYLEGDNVSKGDNCFSRVLDETHNDQVLAITQQQLMAVVESRVLDDLANALSRYQNAHAAYPWLSPFSAPATNAFNGSVGARSGLLPLRRFEADTADPYVFGSDLVFDAPFTLRWSEPFAGTITNSGSAPPSERCLRSTLDSLCTSGTAFVGSVPLQGDVSGIVGGEWNTGLCKALKGRKLSCRAVRLIVDPGSPARLRRTYTVVLTNWAYTFDAPTAASRRTQHFIRESSVLATAPQPELAEIALSDVLIAADGTETPLGSSRLTLAAGSVVQKFELINVPFDQEVDDDDRIDPSDSSVDPDPDTDPATRHSPGELPYWLVANQWHHLLYVAYAAAHAPGDTVTDCASHVDGCLTVNWSRAGSPAATLPVDGLVLEAGAAITQGSLAQTRPGSGRGDYFENANAVDDLQFDQGEAATGFNDRVRILEFDD